MVTSCVCGGSSFRPLQGSWICRECGRSGGDVRPFKRVRVQADKWHGRAHWDLDAQEYRQQILREARQWAREQRGTVVIQIYRNPGARIATIQCF